MVDIYLQETVEIDNSLLRFSNCDRNLWPFLGTRSLQNTLDWIELHINIKIP